MNMNVDPRDGDEDDIDDDKVEIEVVDDVAPEEKPRTKKPVEDDDDEDDALEQVSAKVKKRLDKLTFKFREAERREAEARRLQDEALKYAQQVAEENKNLRKNVESGQTAFVDQAKARATSELERAKKAFKDAYEAGDAEALAEAQTSLTKAQSELMRYENFKPQPVKSTVPERTFEQPKTEQPAQPKLTPLQQEWMNRNPWFGKNRAMTGYAYGVHEELVTSGVDPNTRTYYDEIDKAMRKRFADEFDDGGEDVEVDDTPKKKPAAVVAGAQRSTKTPRKIRLTATQAALARRLGITPEQYAAQMLKELKNG